MIAGETKTFTIPIYSSVAKNKQIDASGMTARFAISDYVNYDSNPLFSCDCSVFTPEGEPLAVLRVYLVSPSGEPSTGFYIEGTAGADIIFSNENVHTVFDAGAGFGFRKEFDSFYIEPMARFGYPYIFEIGFGTGLRF